MRVLEQYRQLKRGQALSTAAAHQPAHRLASRLARRLASRLPHRPALQLALWLAHRWASPELTQCSCCALSSHRKHHL